MKISNKVISADNLYQSNITCQC